jgi:hypothetical protein
LLHVSSFCHVPEPSQVCGVWPLHCLAPGLQLPEHAPPLHTLVQGVSLTQPPVLLHC